MAAVRVAFLGCGNIQNKHVRTFLPRGDVEIVGLCDPSAAAIDRLVERSGLADAGPLPPRFDDAAAMYDAVKPDAVSIATPHTMHFAQAMEALDRGCHVLLEKPMVTAAADAYTLRDKVNATGKVLLVAYNTPCTPEMKYIRQAVRDGEFGKLQVISGYISQGWMTATAGTWRQDPALSGGGMAYDSGAHPLASLCWTVESRVAEVFAFVDNCGTPVDINSALAIRFENGVLATLSIDGNCQGNDADMHYMFDNGRIDFNPWMGRVYTVIRGGERIWYPPILDPPTRPGDNFIEAVLGRDEPRVGADMGIIHSELMDAIYKSAKTGQPARPTGRG